MRLAATPSPSIGSADRNVRPPYRKRPGCNRGKSVGRVQETAPCSRVLGWEAVPRRNHVVVRVLIGRRIITRNLYAKGVASQSPG